MAMSNGGELKPKGKGNLGIKGWYRTGVLEQTIWVKAK
jgi:hypothetical protein